MQWTRVWSLRRGELAEAVVEGEAYVLSTEAYRRAKVRRPSQVEIDCEEYRLTPRAMEVVRYAF